MASNKVKGGAYFADFTTLHKKKQLKRKPKDYSVSADETVMLYEVAMGNKNTVCIPMEDQYEAYYKTKKITEFLLMNKTLHTIGVEAETGDKEVLVYVPARYEEWKNE